MALTGRAALLALLGALVVLAAGSGWALLAVEGLLLVGVVVDLATGRERSSTAVQRGRAATSVRLGEPASVTLTVTNPGPRRLRGVLRDAWAPSAGARVTRHQIDVPADERRQVVTALAPTRRGDRPADRDHRPLGRAARPRRAAGRARRAVRRSGAAAVHQPPPSARPTGTPAAVGRPRRGDAAWRRAPSSTPCASTWRATTSARSTGGRPRGSARPPCAPGGRSGTGTS